ncbi:ABC transporter substrate-binding protein [Vallitalea longa]|uniref:ABC transporter substrate-binding protein n=1 Tax=Vallitalea longa TaxID=2936439 RepID=A0A9W5Y7G5_9FIRM|nr:ABC transporter substrate-binding protein [Vallitalea longa]GKX28192.1 ABC transporter substrate-binding protein [Vallitalea longa]
MFKNLKKGISFLLVVVFVLSITLMGCKSKDTTKETDSSKDGAAKEQDVKVLKVYLGGDEKEKQEEVFAAANEMLKTKLPGVQMDIEVIPYGNWTERWKLLTAAGDQMDVAWIGWMLNFDTISREGMLTPLGDLIDKNCPEIKDTIPQFVFDKATVDGNIYAVPNYQQMVEMRTGVRFYKDLADEYIDAEALEAQFTKDLTFDQEDWDALEVYFKKAKENGTLQKGPSPSISWLYKNGFEPIANQNMAAVIRIGDESCTVINRYETPQYKTMIKTMADWYEKGYIREDVLAVESSDKPRADEYVKDGNISWVHETLKDQDKKETKRANDMGNDVELTVVPTVDYQYLSPYGTSTNYAIPFTAKYPDEAIKLINLFNTDKEFYNLMVYGFEGTNYEKIDDNTIKIIDKDSYGLANWATGNTLLGYEIEGGIKGWSEYLDKMHREARQSYLMGFKIDTEPYSTKLQQIDAIIKEYQNALEMGALGSDVEAKYEEFITKLKKAGIDEVIEGFQKQIDEFLAEKNK